MSRLGLPLGALVIVLAGCSGGGGTASPSPILSPTSTVSASPAPTVSATPAASATFSATPSPTVSPTNPAGSPAPATFQLTVAGDASVTGDWGTSYGITCNNPSFDGPDILMFAQAPDQSAVVLLTITSASVSVSERAGAGDTYVERDFAGTGVTTFDPAHGATFDSDVSIVPSTNKPGPLGKITHVSGSVDCGGQMPGVSTVILSGASAEGTISGPFDLARVACFHSTQYGNSVSVSAIVTAGSTPTLLIISLPANGNATIFGTTKGGANNHSYTIDPTGDQSVTATGAHLDADFTEVVSGGATPHVIHLAGDLTCGTTTTS